MRRILALGWLLVACDQPALPAAATAVASASAAPALSSVAATASAAATPTSVTHGAAQELALTWVEPAGWKKLEPNSPMRNASYEVPPAGADPEPGDLGVFFFGPDKSGSVERSVQRWVESFEGIEPSQVTRRERQVNGLTQRIVEIPTGSYKSGMPGGPTTVKPGFALLGAVVETPKGSHFFKLVGPAATVTRAKPRFFQLLDSVKPKAS